MYVLPFCDAILSKHHEHRRQGRHDLHLSPLPTFAAVQERCTSQLICAAVCVFFIYNLAVMRRLLLRPDLRASPCFREACRNALLLSPAHSPLLLSTHLINPSLSETQTAAQQSPAITATTTRSKETHYTRRGHLCIESPLQISLPLPLPARHALAFKLFSSPCVCVCVCVCADTMTHTSTHPTTAVAAPSFLVYPLPSIADETFLQLIFRQHVKLSLFFGFGRSRMAVVELSSADVAQAVLAAVAGGATAEVGYPAAKKATREKTTEAARDVTDMTLADMFAAPTTTGDADNRSDQREPHSTVVAVNTSEDFSHLPCLVYRGRPVHVVVSGVRVADFYAGGGAVPEKHEDKEERSNAKKKARREKALRGDDDAIPVAPRVPKVSAFPKNACQRCGSLEHFTRNCDGSGAASAAVEPPAGKEGVDDAAPSSSAPSPAPSAAVTAVAAARSAASIVKECCKKCGSPSHFTRHCDGSGAAATALTAAPSVSTAVSASQPPVKATLRAAPAPMPKPVGVVPAPVVHRTSKDQCKHCGSDSHLSRHCPNK